MVVQGLRERTTGSFDLWPEGRQPTGATLGPGAVFAGFYRCFSKGDTETESAAVGGGTALGLGCSVSDGCSGGRACAGETAGN